jgi:crotonobetainyl-CoA:carnitine CoA-transferase CaiB-like acyl-CoA transferase
MAEGPAPAATEASGDDADTFKNTLAVNAYYRTFETKDSMIAVAALNPTLRRKFTEAIGLPDPRSQDRTLPRTGPEGRAIAEKYVAEVEARMLELTTDEWLQRFDEANVPAGPYRRIGDLIDDPQVIANELSVELEHPVAKTIRMVGPLVRMSETPPSARTASPTLGQHTDEILADLGFSTEELAALRASGIVA